MGLLYPRCPLRSNDQVEFGQFRSATLLHVPGCKKHTNLLLLVQHHVLFYKMIYLPQ